VIIPALRCGTPPPPLAQPTGTEGRVGAVLLAAAGSMAVSVAFWYGAGGSVSIAAMTGVGVHAALALLLGSVLAAAVPAAVLLPRTDSPAVRPTGGDARPQLAGTLQTHGCCAAQSSTRPLGHVPRKTG
jgi:hypothetical protein